MYSLWVERTLAQGGGAWGTVPLDQFMGWVAAAAWVVLAVSLCTHVWACVRVGRAQNTSWLPSYMEMASVWAALAVLWWFIAGGFQIERIVPVAAASILGLSAGALIGFIFTTYAEESQSIGKIRDWLIAGLATLSLAEIVTGADRVKAVLAMFRDPAGVSPIGVVLASIVGFSVLGFMGSFILRELILNVSFAKARNERKRLESAIAAEEDAILKIAAERRTELGKYREDDQVTPEVHAIARRIIALLRASRSCTASLGLEQARVVAECYLILEEYAMAAATYAELLERFGYDEQTVVGLATAYERLKAYKAAGAVIEEHLLRLPEFAKQWMGFYLLWDKDRLEDAVKFSTAYLKVEPKDLMTLFNLACAYAQLFARHESDFYRDLALKTLAEVWERDIDRRPRIRLLFDWDDDFYVFRSDQAFAQFREQ